MGRINGEYAPIEARIRELMDAKTDPTDPEAIKVAEAQRLHAGLNG